MKIVSSFSTGLLLGLAGNAAGHEEANSENWGEHEADDAPLEWLGHVGSGLSGEKSSKDNREPSREEGHDDHHCSVSSAHVAGSISHWHLLVVCSKNDYTILQQHAYLQIIPIFMEIIGARGFGVLGF